MGAYSQELNIVVHAAGAGVGCRHIYNVCPGTWVLVVVLAGMALMGVKG